MKRHALINVEKTCLVRALLGICGIFPILRLELYETGITDVDLAHDFFLPFPRLDSKGIRVHVRLGDYGLGQY